MKKRNLKSQNIVQLVMVVGILILLNISGSYLFTRFDLTGEKRYTLSPATIKLVSELKDIVYVKVYLEGDFPPGFNRLSDATREMLDEMRAYSNGNIEYEFIDPSASSDEKERNRIYNQLAGLGLQPTNLEEKNKEGSSQKIIFPGAVFSYLSQQSSLQLLKDQLGAPPEQMLNNSIEGLEYEISNTIRKITQYMPIQIAFIEGQGEIDKYGCADLAKTLAGAYGVDRIAIDNNLHALDIYKVIIIAKPDSAFNEKDKFIIDQFVMRGGKVLWVIDQMSIAMDSLKGTGEAYATAKELNLDDLLFRYGVRINYDLVVDLQAAPIPVIKGYVGNQPQQELRPWYFFPLLIPTSKHPIVNNLNAVRCEFASSMDAVGSDAVKKTVLLSSSRYSRVMKAPVRVNLGIMREEPNPKLFNLSYLPIAMLLEGTFSSPFENRVVPVNNESGEVKTKSVPNKMIVIADGDIIKNEVRKSNGNIFPLGYDKFTGQQFGNKNFILNCIDYLSDESGLIAVRSKEIRLRMLDNTLITEAKATLIWINTIGPVLIMVAFGLYKNWKRKRRFGI